MSSHSYMFVVRLYNSCDCEIACEYCDTKEQVNAIVAEWIETIENGDRIEFEVR